MTDLLRQEIAATSHLIVVKVGTRVLTNTDGTLNETRISSLAEDINAVLETGRSVVLVSSGAVGAGISQLGLHSRPTDLAQLQAVAAVGQTRLLQTYDRTFHRHGRVAAQVLLIADDLDDRTRYLNVRNTLLSLLDYDVIPILNENDTVSVEELMTTFGDNDHLAAVVTNLLGAPLLVILSDVDGVYDGDPALESSRVIPLIKSIDQSIWDAVQDHQSGLSKGGMASKLNAARMVTKAGENVIIAGGHNPSVLQQIMAGEPQGTLILAQGKRVSPWKLWIAFSARPQGKLILDDGACSAVCKGGRSLLAIGVTEVNGQFAKGDVVSICAADRKEFARGLTNYSDQEVHRIMGANSDQIAELLGHRPYTEVVHRNNLTVLD